jgi:hypothetical protein
MCAKMVPKELTEKHCLWGSLLASNTGTPSLFTGSSPKWLFSIPEYKWNIGRKVVWWHWWHQK